MRYKTLDFPNMYHIVVHNSKIQNRIIELSKNISPSRWGDDHDSNAVYVYFFPRNKRFESLEKLNAIWPAVFPSARAFSSPTNNNLPEIFFLITPVSALLSWYTIFPRPVLSCWNGALTHFEAKSISGKKDEFGTWTREQKASNTTAQMMKNDPPATKAQNETEEITN